MIERTDVVLFREERTASPWIHGLAASEKIEAYDLR